MRRTIMAVVAGYIIMVLLIFVLFGVVWLVVGADGLFAPGRYEASTLWMVQSVVVAFLAAVGAGFVTGRAGGRASVRGLACLIVAVGLFMAWPVINGWPDWRPADRPADVSMMDATRNARQPSMVAASLPFVGALGAWLGGSGIGRRGQ